MVVAAKFATLRQVRAAARERRDRQQLARRHSPLPQLRSRLERPLQPAERTSQPNISRPEAAIQLPATRTTIRRPSGGQRGYFPPTTGSHEEDRADRARQRQSDGTRGRHGRAVDETVQQSRGDGERGDTKIANARRSARPAAGDGKGTAWSGAAAPPSPASAHR